MDQNCCINPFPINLKTPNDFEILDAATILDLQNPEKNQDRQKIVNLTNSINRVINDIRSNNIGYGYQNFSDDYPLLTERANRGQFFAAEISVFTNDYQVNLDNMNNTFGAYQTGTNINNDLDTYLGNLNTFYTTNLGASLSGGFCAAFTNIFEKITLLISLVKQIASFVNDLQNANPEDIIAGILQAVFGPIINVINSIIKTIENLAKAFLQAVESIEEGLKQVVADIEEGAAAISQAIKRRVNDVKEFFSNDNMDSLKQYIERMITAAASAFESLDPWIIGMLMYRFCQLTNALQAFMKNPVDGLQKFAEGMVRSQIVLANVSNIRRKEAVSANALRFDDQEKRTARREAALAMNSAAQSPQAIVRIARENEATARQKISTQNERQSLGVTQHPLYGSDPSSVVDQVIENAGLAFSEGIQQFNAGTVNWFDTVEIKPYTALTDFTPNEINDVQKLQRPFSTGCPPKIVFAGPIFEVTTRKDGVETNNQGPGWQDVNDSVWVKLLRVYEQIGYTQIVSDGFNPNHPHLSTGRAVAIVTNGENSILYLIIAASRAGFSEIHVEGFNQVILADTGKIKASFPGSIGSFFATTYIEAALEKHQKSEWILASGNLPVEQIRSSRITNLSQYATVG